VLPTGQIYALWLVNPTAGRFLPVGRFAAAQDGSAALDVSLKGSVPDGFSLVLVTVQPNPQADTATASNKYAIVGFFPQNTAIQQQVKHLPDTGEHAQHPPFEPASAIVPDNPPTARGSNPFGYALLVLAALSVAFLLRRNYSKRIRTGMRNDTA
jgi:hypothetical protein